MIQLIRNMVFKNRELELYINILNQIKKMSYASRDKVASLIIKDNNIISYGFNGTPTLQSNECEEGDITKSEVMHAEMNAIMKCAKLGISTRTTILMTTTSPCMNCAKYITISGIHSVYYDKQYSKDFDKVSELFRSNGIKFLNYSNKIL